LKAKSAFFHLLIEVFLNFLIVNNLINYQKILKKVRTS